MNLNNMMTRNKKKLNPLVPDPTMGLTLNSMPDVTPLTPQQYQGNADIMTEMNGPAMGPISPDQSQQNIEALRRLQMLMRQ